MTFVAPPPGLVNRAAGAVDSAAMEHATAPSRREHQKFRRGLIHHFEKQTAKEHRARLEELRHQIRLARAEWRDHLQKLRHEIRARWKELRAAWKARRKELAAALRQAIAYEAQAERDLNRATRAAAKKGKDDAVKAASDRLVEERRHWRQIRGDERRSAEERHKTHLDRKLLRQQADEEVERELPDRLIPLWHQMRQGFRGKPNMSRAEAFLHYAEEHPNEVAEALGEDTEQWIEDAVKHEKEMVKRHRQAEARERRANAATKKREAKDAPKKKRAKKPKKPSPEGVPF